MINYKSFKLPGNAKLRVRADKIVATVSSKSNNSVDVFVEGVATPWHIVLGDEKSSKIIDYVWERHNIEIENEEEEDNVLC